MTVRRGSPGMGLRGRRELTALVRECLEAEPSETRPVITLLGPHGSGASEAHGTLMAEFGENDAPFAYLNFAAERPDPRYALGRIARQLERKLPSYQVSRFPRLTLGQFAADNDLGQVESVERTLQRSSLLRQLAQYENRSFETFSDTVAAVSVQAGQRALGLPDNTPPLFEPLVKGAVSKGARAFGGLLSKRRFTESAQWYGEHRLTGGSRPWDAVLDLNHWSRSGTEEGRLKLEQILMEAFLEDLRHNANRQWGPKSHLLLLDDCHTPDGLRFLDLLISARSQDHAGGKSCAPLTTVVSTNLWLPRWGSSSGKQWMWTPTDPDGSSLGDWRERRPYTGSSDSWWYPLRLRDLSLDEVRARLSTGPPRDQALAPFIHRLTAGLPRAVHQVITLLDRADFPAENGRERDAWLRLLPDRTLPGPEPAGDGGLTSGGLPLVDAALGMLLSGFTETQRSTLAECAVAVDLSISSQVLTENTPALPGTSLFTEARSRFLLYTRSADRPTLHPWLRRLLLWKLAENEEDWDTAHGLLGDHFESEGRTTQEMYHRLAAHDVETVTEYLVGRYRTVNARQWIDEFNAITAAPNRHPRTRGHLELVSQLTAGTPRTDDPVEPAVRALVVTRWLWSDPLTDPGMRLSPMLYQHFGRLSEHPRSDNLHLFNEAERYSSWLHPQTHTVEG